METIAVAVLGAGGIGRHHLRSWRRLAALLPGRVRLRVVSCRVTPPEVLAGWGAERVVADWQDAVDDDAVDVVDICLPDSLHAEAAHAALARGRQVICEKPLGRSPAESAGLESHAREVGSHTAVCFVYRHLAAAGYAADLIRRGELGTVREIRGHYLQSWLLEPHEPSWREDPRGGGVLGDLGCHLVDLAGAVIAAPAVDVVQAAGTDPVRRASWLFGYSDGILGTFSVSRTAPGHSNDLQLEVSGDKGSLRFGSERPQELRWSPRGSGESAVLRINDMEQRPWLTRWWPVGEQLGWDDLFVHQLHDTVAALLNLERGTALPSADFAQAAAVDALVARIRTEEGNAR